MQLNAFEIPISKMVHELLVSIFFFLFIQVPCSGETV